MVVDDKNIFAAKIFPLNMLKITYSLFILILCALSVTGQNVHSDISVSGRVTDQQAKPVGFANIILLTATDSVLVKATTTDEEGRYFLEQIHPGRYILKISGLDFLPTLSKIFEFSRNDRYLLEDLHVSASAHQLNKVTITASRPLIERKSDRLVMNVENSILATGNSAFEILERAPGVTIDKDDNISLRGKSGVSVMINDKLMYLSSSQLATLLRGTDGNTVKSIEVITNPSAKYDAAGNSGILNIKLKRDSKSGTNGNVVLGAAAGKYFRDNGSLNLNHHQGKINLFSSFSHSDNKRFKEIKLNRIVGLKSGGQTFFKEDTKTPYQNHNNSFRIGADFEMSKRNTIGFVASGFRNSNNENSTNFTKIGSFESSIDSTVNSLSDTRQKFENIALNLNNKFLIDTSGQVLSIDLDYSRFRNSDYSEFHNDFLLADGRPKRPQEFLTNRRPSDIYIRTGKADYSKLLSSTLKLEAGIKYSNVKTDNNLQAQVLKDEELINDPSRSNHFIYKEKVSAGYINFNKQISQTSIQVGLRTEHTNSNGNLIGSTSVNRSYFNFFPSAFIAHTLNVRNEVSFSYSRRIDRPGYDNLNPFISYISPFSFFKGNSFLNPQFTNNFEATYTYNKSVNASLVYSHTSDAITDIVLTDGNKTFQTQRNLQSSNYYSFSLNSTHHLSKWWTANIDFNGFYSKFETDTIVGQHLNTGKAAFQIKALQTLSVGAYKAEVISSYTSSRVYGSVSIKPNYFVDAGVSRSFAAEKLNIKLAVSDIFDTRRTRTTSQILNNNFSYRQKYDSRVIRLNLTYNFGNRKVKVRQHKTGSNEEENRVKSAG